MIEHLVMCCSNNGFCYVACTVHVTIFSTGGKFCPVSNFVQLHALPLATCSCAEYISATFSQQETSFAEFHIHNCSLQTSGEEIDTSWRNMVDQLEVRAGDLQASFLIGRCGFWVFIHSYLPLVLFLLLLSIYMQEYLHVWQN